MKDSDTLVVMCALEERKCCWFVTALVAYIFFGLGALGDELEEPFGVLPNDLPIVALAETIEINLREALDETDLPPLPQPKDYMLM